MALWLTDCDSLDSDILCDCRPRPNKKRKREGQTQAAEVADLTRVIRVIKSLKSRKLFHIESMAWWVCDQLMSKPIQTVLNRKRGFAAALRFEQALAEPVVETEVQEEAEAPAEVAEVSVNKKSKKPKKDSNIGYRFLHYHVLCCLDPVLNYLSCNAYGNDSTLQIGCWLNAMPKNAPILANILDAAVCCVTGGDGMSKAFTCICTHPWLMLGSRSGAGWIAT